MPHIATSLTLLTTEQFLGYKEIFIIAVDIRFGVTAFEIAPQPAFSFVRIFVFFFFLSIKTNSTIGFR